MSTTVRQIISSALRRLNVTSANSPPTAEDVQICQEALNSLIDSMSNQLLNIHTISPMRFPLTPNKQSYTLGPATLPDGTPSGADWVTERPMRLESAVLMVYPVITPAPPPGP